MARAREEIRLLGDPAGADGGFTPRLETAGDNMAPPSSSRLRLADELDTYIDRIQVGVRYAGRNGVFLGCF